MELLQPLHKLILLEIPLSSAKTLPYNHSNLHHSSYRICFFQGSLYRSSGSTFCYFSRAFLCPRTNSPSSLIKFSFPYTHRTSNILSVAPSSGVMSSPFPSSTIVWKAPSTIFRGTWYFSPTLSTLN